MEHSETQLQMPRSGLAASLMVIILGTEVPAQWFGSRATEAYIQVYLHTLVVDGTVVRQERVDTQPLFRVPQFHHCGYSHEKRAFSDACLGWDETGPERDLESAILGLVSAI